MPDSAALFPTFDAPEPAPPPEPQTHQVQFTGSGGEYFKIWIVNLLLTVATLGIYSAWAKVRRLQYFDRNTELAGAVFDFDGKPAAILRGRLLAVALAAAYHYAFGFSLTVGFAVVALLLASLPLMLRGALRFRLHNTRYRGLRLGFDGGAGAAYLAYLPPVLLFVMPAVIAALSHDPRMGLGLLVGYLVWPLMHGAMKRYQHRHLRFGSIGSTFDIRKRRFYMPYLGALGLVLLGAFCMGVVAALLIAAMRALPAMTAHATTVGALTGVAVVYVAYILSIPLVQVRIGNMVWSGTSFPGVTISSTMSAWDMMKLQTVNTVLTLLTLGLYRPFAVVRTYAYRVSRVSVTTEGGFDKAVAAVTATPASATADGVADFFGIDISW